MKKKVNIEFNPDKRFFIKKYLDENEINYLKNKGYMETKRKSCFFRIKNKYLVKPRTNESVQHFFLTMDIANYLKSMGFKVEIFQTLKPDIVFAIYDEKIAIEIETGKVLRNNRKQLIAKVKLLNKNYNYWFFVLTNRNLKKKYKPYGIVIDKRYLKNYLEKFISERIFY